VEQIVTCSPWRTPHWSKWLCPEAHGYSMPEQAPGGSCGLQIGAHAGAGFLAGSVACEGSTLEQSVPEGLHPLKGTHAGAVCEELWPVGRSHAGGRTVSMGGTLIFDQISLFSCMMIILESYCYLYMQRSFLKVNNCDCEIQPCWQ